MKKNLSIKDKLTEFLLYTSPNGKIKLEVFLHNETIWLTQKRIAELFGVGVPAISKHMMNIFLCGELVEDSVVSILETTAKDGKQYNTKYYNLDAIISVGYRVNSSRGTQFRIWATSTLRQHLIQGYTVNDKRLEQLKQSLLIETDNVNSKGWAMSVRVLGVGGAGFNAISRMIKDPVSGVEYAAIDTDFRSVSEWPSLRTLLIGDKHNGTGGNKVLGELAVEQNKNEIQEHIGNVEVLILNGGMGGGTGTGAIPAIARLAGEMGIFTIAVVTLPFNYEGDKRILRAEEGIELLKKEIDVLITVHNDEVDALMDEDASFKEAMELANNVLVHTVKEVSRLQGGQEQLNRTYERVKGFFEGADERMVKITRVVRGVCA